MAGVTLDAGGLIALDRNDRRVIVLLARAVETNSRVTIPSSALAQATRREQHGCWNVRRVDAVNVGRLLAASGTSDVVDAHVVVCARRSAQRVVTSDATDLSLLDPTLELIIV